MTTARFLAVGAMAAIVSGCGGEDAQPTGSVAAPSTAPPVPEVVTKAGASKVDGADFLLEEHPPLEQKVDLASLPENDQKAIYFEFQRLMDDAANRVMLSDVDVDKLSSEEAYRLMENVQNKAAYEFAASRGFTIDQLDKLNVDAMRFGWQEEYLRQ